MKRIFLAIAVSLAAAMAGCTDHEEVGYDIDPKVLIPKNGLQEIVLTDAETQIDYEVWIFRSGYNEGVSTASLTVDAAALADYNKANGTAYEPMPAACYQLPATTVRIGNDGHAARIGITIDASAIAPGSLYVLPLSIDSPDTPVSESAATVLIRPVRPAAEEPAPEK